MKRSLSLTILLAALLGAVACDDEVPEDAGDPTLLGGHWVGEGGVISAPPGPAIAISTDDGEIRIITFMLEDFDSTDGHPDLPPMGFQMVANVSADGGPSEEIQDVLESEFDLGDDADLFDTGLTGNVKLYVPMDLIDTSTPAGIPSEGGPPVLSTAFIGCSSAGAGEGECTYDGAIAEGVGLFGVIESVFEDPEEEPDVVAYHLGEYEGESYEMPSSLDNLVGSWSSTSGPAGFDVASDGTIDGGDIAGCEYGGSFSIVDSSVNAYRMNLDVSNCGDWNGAYTGLAAVLDAELIGDMGGDMGGDLPDATEGDVMIFQVDNGAFSISSMMVSNGPPR
jgi:hypothetical protein